jgi:cell division protein FtsW (lipid II flippase)
MVIMADTTHRDAYRTFHHADRHMSAGHAKSTMYGRVLMAGKIWAEPKNTMTYAAARRMGFVAAFAVFATVLYCILWFFRKLPAGLEYWHVLAVVVLLSIAGFTLKWLVSWLRQ